jgi:hypothetical protein
VGCIYGFVAKKWWHASLLVVFGFRVTMSSPSSVVVVLLRRRWLEGVCFLSSSFSFFLCGAFGLVY